MREREILRELSGERTAYDLKEFGIVMLRFGSESMN
jgi:hypothetical protein